MERSLPSASDSNHAQGSLATEWWHRPAEFWLIAPALTACTYFLIQSSAPALATLIVGSFVALMAKQ